MHMRIFTSQICNKQFVRVKHYGTGRAYSNNIIIFWVYIALFHSRTGVSKCFKLLCPTRPKHLQHKKKELWLLIRFTRNIQSKYCQSAMLPGCFNVGPCPKRRLRLQLRLGRARLPILQHWKTRWSRRNCSRSRRFGHGLGLYPYTDTCSHYILSTFQCSVNKMTGILLG